jgi:drug/metabolite transporter (DMT)-like permease
VVSLLEHRDSCGAMALPHPASSQACCSRLNFLLLYWGLEYTTAARSVIFLNTSPFFVALGAHIALTTIA